jgi:hypothetical protein
MRKLIENAAKRAAQLPRAFPAFVNAAAPDPEKACLRFDRGAPAFGKDRAPGKFPRQGLGTTSE